MELSRYASHIIGRKRRRSHSLVMEGRYSDSTVESRFNVIITHIRVTGIVTRLRRIPVGFYVEIKHENETQRTSNKPVSVGKNMVEWNDEITLPSDPSSTITLKVVASFELGQTLGAGEVLREFETTVGKLMNCDRQFGPIRLLEQDDEEVKIYLETYTNAQEYKVAPSPQVIPPVEIQRPEELTSMGHQSLVHYREHQEQRDIDESIKFFEQARDLCPPDCPSYATILFNLANANLMYCRVVDAFHRLDTSIDLYRTALRLRPRGHPNHPFTLLSLGVSLKTRFQRRKNELPVDEEEGNTLLSQVLDVSSPDSYVYHAAILALRCTADAELVPRAHVSQAIVNGEDKDGEDDEDDEEESIDRLDATLQWMFHVETPGHTMLDHLGVLVCLRLDFVKDFVDPNGAISVLDIVVQSTCDDHPDKASWLDNLGVSLLTRYLESASGDPLDLERAISTTEKAVQLTAEDDADKPLRITTLGNAFFIRYEYIGDTADLEKSISTREEALLLAQEDHPNRPGLLSNLGHTLSSRYERFGDIADLEKSISAQEEAVRLTLDDPERSTWLSNLGCSLFTRYECCGDVADLERSISMLEDALELTPDDGPDKPTWLANLGRMLSARYGRFGDVDNLEKSVSLVEDAVHLTPDGHPAKPMWLNNLGSLLSDRYERLGDVNDLEKSISMGEDAVRLTCDGHLNKPKWFTNLGSLLLVRYDRFGDTADLERSISLREVALELTPDESLDKPTFLDNLGLAVLARYRRFGHLVDLEKSISIGEHALRLTPDGHPDKSKRLNNLGSSLLNRYERFGDVADLEKSISMREHALRLTPDGHPDKPTIQDHLGYSLLTNFERFGDVDALEKSVLAREEALRLTPQDDMSLKKCQRLSNLGRSLLVRYERFGEVGDLQKSISMGEDALRLTPEDFAGRPMRLADLGDALWVRYRHFGIIADLEKSISMTEESLRLTSDDHPNKPSRLNSFGHSLLARYDYFGNTADLQQSISVFEEVVRSIQDDHLDKASVLDSLGTSLGASYARFGEIADLEKSILLEQEAAQLTPDDHPARSVRLNNLGNSLLTRYGRLEQVADLENAVSMRGDAARLVPDGHPDKPTWFQNLGSSLLVRYRKFGDAIDLETSILMLNKALQSTPDGHPSGSSMLNSLAHSYLERFRHSGDKSPSDLLQSIMCCSQASRSSVGPTSERFQATQLWVQCLRLLPHDPKAVLDVYTLSVELLPQLAWIGLSLHDRYYRLLQAADTVRDAAAAALELGKSELAVEWLEQGRSIMWSQLSQLRTPIDDLRSSHPELAAEFERVSHGLERTGSQVEDRLRINELTNLGNSISLDRSSVKQAERHNSLALRREGLLKDIRALPGFERFLLPETIHQLSSLAHSGHVVLLNASKHRCDALVVMASPKQVIHVPLSRTNYSEIVNMQRQLSNVLRNNGRIILPNEIEPERGARLTRLKPNDVFRLILSDLWKKVVNPILSILGLSTPPTELSRIFWCPTGPFTFLPIHAAGIYGPTDLGSNLSEFAISSYIPTISALKESPQQGAEVRLLAVPQPSTDGQRHLYGVKEEMLFMRELTSSSPFVDFQEADGTVEDVLERMKESDWVHFCCHGTQDQTNPLDSGLLLSDCERLKLHDIVQLSRPRGGLAFLSACQTAMGDEQLSDEAIHLAAGMLLAGYSGVIATMWSIMDNDAPRVTREVYGELFGDGRVPDSRRAAEALHHTVERLRGSGVPFLSWVPFVHYGL